MKTPFSLLHRTAALAKKRGVTVPPFTLGQVGDAYHVYGVSLTPAKLLAHLTRKKTT